MKHECLYCEEDALLISIKELRPANKDYTIIKTKWKCEGCEKEFITTRRKECSL